MPEVEAALKITGTSIQDVLGSFLEALQSAQADGTGIGTDPQSQASLKVVRDHYSGIQNRDIQKIKDTTDASFALTSDTLPSFASALGSSLAPGGNQTNKDGYVALWQQLWSSFPNTQYSIEREIPVGDTVVVLWRGQGKQTGSWAGFTPTGLASGQGIDEDIRGVSVFRVANGKVVADYDYFDRGKLAAQISQFTGQTVSFSNTGALFTAGSAPAGGAAGFAGPSGGHSGPKPYP